MGFFVYVFAFIVAIGVLVVVHEFGHFSVARALGVKVLRFSVGFGRPIWLRHVGKDRTEFCISAIPFGGYVKMLGELGDESPVPAKDRRRAFNRQPVWKRLLIVVAGPAFNFMFAILAYALVFIIGIDGIRPVVARVFDDTPAQRAGFKPDDRILSIDGEAVVSWDQRRLYLFQQALDRSVVKIEVRDASGALQTRLLDLSNFPKSGIDASLMERGIGMSPMPLLPVELGNVDKGPAQTAGLLEGDQLVRIDGKPVETVEDAVAVIRQSPNKSLRFDVKRGGVARTFTVVPLARQENGKDAGYILASIGVTPPLESLHVKLKLPLVTALRESVVETWRMSWLTLEMFYRMVKLEVSAKSISGPLTIAKYAGATAKLGFVQFLLFLSVVSISLGVLNLLPIPLLDGGHVLYYLVEAVRRKPASERVLLAGQRVGFLLLGMLMVIALYNDISGLSGDIARMYGDIARFFQR